MTFRSLPIKGAFEIIATPFRDPRGTFLTAYDERLFHDNGLVTNWVADNLSFNVSAGTLRGFHFQAPPHGQTKLVRAVSGIALDVIVDLRKDSPSYLAVYGVELSEERANALYVPKGCGHAYLTLSDRCIITYKVDAHYAPESEGGVRWNDPDLHFDWPFKGSPIISLKDGNWPLLSEGRNPF